MKTQLIFCLTLALTPFILNAQYDIKALEKSEKTIATYKEMDTKFDTYFEEAYGYVVFSSVGKGGLGIGGAYGVGTVYELGKPIGKAKLAQVSIGFQFGGQDYSQVVFFETKGDFLRFKENRFEFAAQASAVVIKTGVSTNLAYREGVAVFTKPKGGFMYEASLSGQKLKFKAYRSKRSTSKAEK
jgi:lipid-binding SYLF domain-containing protein